MKKKMTEREFFKRLKRLGRKWQVTKLGSIRSGKTCPVSAVAGIVGICYSSEPEVKKLNISDNLFASITCVADAHKCTRPACASRRKKLLRVLGLKERLSNGKA